MAMPVDDLLDDQAARMIWRSVLATALADSVGLDLRLSGTGGNREAVVHGARAFLGTDTLHRNLVLEAAGFEVHFWNQEVARLRGLWRASDRGELPAGVRKPKPGRRPLKVQMAVAA